jgi:hypothetical protein
MRPVAASILAGVESKDEAFETTAAAVSQALAVAFVLEARTVFEWEGRGLEALARSMAARLGATVQDAEVGLS